MYPLIGFFLLAHLEAATAFLIAGSYVILTSLAMEAVQLLGATFVRYFYAFICIIPFMPDFSFKNYDYKPARFICNFHFGYFVLLYLLYDLQHRITIHHF